MDNKSKVDALHDLLPTHLNTRTNPNWKALVDALGTADQNTTDLITQIRAQFFVKTASRPYLDKLGGNSMVSRPALVGMDDPAFRQYIPILSYQPKQVKLIVDQLLDIFFFKESTTAYITTQAAQPFTLQNGWEFEYLVDELNNESIKFSSADFTDITKATATEIASAINRQAQFSYAEADYDSITKNTYVRLFTKTIGSKGSIRIAGGRGNIALQFNGFIFTAGNGANTQWTLTKVGQDVTLQHTGGQSPNINQLLVGDIVVLDLPGPSGNKGSFEITYVDLANDQIMFENLFAVAGVYTQTNVTQSKFLRPNKYVAYLNPRRAMTWEVNEGEITVEMPTSPPVVKRSLKGSAHINGPFSLMTLRNSNTSLTVNNAFEFPNAGSFWLQPVLEIKSHIITPSENIVLADDFNTRLMYPLQKFSYTSRTVLTTTGNIIANTTQITNLASTVGLAIGQQVSMAGVPPYATITNITGSTVDISNETTATATAAAVSFLGNTLTGITPDLPPLAATNGLTMTSLSRSGNVISGTTAVPNSLSAGDQVIVSGSSGIQILSTTGTTVTGSNQLTGLASVVALAPDLLIAGIGIPAGTKIQSISGTTVIMTQNATASNVGTPVTFSEDLNGGFTIQSVSGNTFTYNLIGSNGSAGTAGTERVEKPGLAPTGSVVYITGSISSDITRIKGPYVWDLGAPYTLSSDMGPIADAILAGKIVRLLNLGTNTIPPDGGHIIFDYGLNTQEGPVRYLYKPTSNTIALDPSYTFKFNHSIGSNIVLIGSFGPHRMSGVASEYAPYITDPSAARIILEKLILSVKSSGIFVNFLVHYPEQLYGLFDVYNEQGLPNAGEPFGD